MQYRKRLRSQFQESEKDPVQVLRTSRRARSHAITATITHEYDGEERGRPVYRESVEILEAAPKSEGGGSPIDEIYRRYDDQQEANNREIEAAIFGNTALNSSD